VLVSLFFEGIREMSSKEKAAWKCKTLQGGFSPPYVVFIQIICCLNSIEFLS